LETSARIERRTPPRIPELVDLARLIDEVIGTAGQLAEKNKNLTSPLIMRASALAIIKRY
jgi:hypothetical protein